MEITAYQLAERWAQLAPKELPGKKDNPFILGMLRLDASWPEADEVPWCSAFVNFIAWQLRLPRSKSLRARSWLLVGTPVSIEEARQGFDVVIFNRGNGPQDPSVIKAPGHVAFFSSLVRQYTGPNEVYVIGGNQNNTVSLRQYTTRNLLGVRRLWSPPQTS